MKPIDERLQEFKEKVWQWIKQNDPKHKEYPIWLLKEFVNHWTQINDNGRKMYFEFEKRWSTGGRLATWKNNSMNWHPKKWEKQSKPTITQPIQFEIKSNDYYEQNYGKIDYDAAKERMKNEPKSNTGTLGELIRKQIGE